MNEHQKLTREIPLIREEIGYPEFDKITASLILLTIELDFEIDGVSLPGGAAAIINRLRSINAEIEEAR